MKGNSRPVSQTPRFSMTPGGRAWPARDHSADPCREWSEVAAIMDMPATTVIGIGNEALVKFRMAWIEMYGEESTR